MPLGDMRDRPLALGSPWPIPDVTMKRMTHWRPIWERGFPIVETILTNEANEALWSLSLAAQGLFSSARALHVYRS